MRNLKYRKMGLRQLFAELREVSVHANQLVIDGCAVRDQHLWMATKYEICDEIDTRGPEEKHFMSAY